MGVCEMCGNEYAKTFDVVIGGETRTFDSFECAIELCAPRCGHCACRIIGHGVEAGDQMFCCANCASHEGIGQLRDHLDAATTSS